MLSKAFWTDFKCPKDLKKKKKLHPALGQDYDEYVSEHLIISFHLQRILITNLRSELKIGYFAIVMLLFPVSF